MNTFLQLLRGSSDGPAADQSIVVVGLLLFLVAILFVGIFFLWLATRQFRARRFEGLISRRAARWSLDPTLIDERQFKTSRGIAGDLSETKPN